MPLESVKMKNDSYALIFNAKWVGQGYNTYLHEKNSQFKVGNRIQSPKFLRERSVSSMLGNLQIHF